MPGGWWCCCGCWTFTDDFDRDDANEIGNWEEVDGQWEIHDHLLRCLLDELPARLVGRATVPTRSAGEMSIYVDFIDYQVGDAYVVYAGLSTPKDGDGPYVTFTYLGSNEWLVEIFGGGTDGMAQMTGDPISQGRQRAHVCMDSDGSMKAGVISLGDQWAFVDDLGAQHGTYYGLGALGGTGTATNDTGTGTEGHALVFDNFYVTELRIEKGHTDVETGTGTGTGTATATIHDETVCAECFCRCADNNTRRHLKGTFIAPALLDDGITPNRAACINGESFDIDWIVETGVVTWKGTHQNLDNPGHILEFKFELSCGVYDPANPTGHYMLVMGTPKICCGSTICGPFTPDQSSTCEPFYLLFGPYIVSYLDLACFLCVNPAIGLPNGKYYIAVSEA